MSYSLPSSSSTNWDRNNWTTRNWNILHGLTIHELFSQFFKEVSVGPEINFPTTDWCRQNTHNCASTAHLRTQCTSTVTRTRVAPGRTAQDCALWLHPSVMSHTLPHLSQKTSTRSLSLSSTIFRCFFYGFVFRNWIKKLLIHSGVADAKSASHTGVLFSKCDGKCTGSSVRMTTLRRKFRFKTV